MAEKKLTRSSNKKIAGVCAGLANYFDMDPTVVRVIYAILFLITGLLPLIIVYIILCFAMPQE